LIAAGLMPYLEKLGFHLVGYGCTTCIGNSGPLPEPVANAVKKENLTRAMFTGIKRVPESLVRERRDGPRSTPPRRIASREYAYTYFASWRRALALLMVAMVLVWIVIRGH
jgi:hypothetical protein